MSFSTKVFHRNDRGCECIASRCPAPRCDGIRNSRRPDPSPDPVTDSLEPILDVATPSVARRLKKTNRLTALSHNLNKFALVAAIVSPWSMLCSVGEWHQLCAEALKPCAVTDEPFTPNPKLSASTKSRAGASRPVETTPLLLVGLLHTYKPIYPM